MKQVSLAEARDRLSALVNDAAHGGQRIVLSSRGRPKAALIGMQDLERLEREERGATTLGREMRRWIERVETVQRGWVRVKRSSTDALHEAGGEYVHPPPHGRRYGSPRRNDARRVAMSSAIAGSSLPRARRSAVSAVAMASGKRPAAA